MKQMIVTFLVLISAVGCQHHTQPNETIQGSPEVAEAIHDFQNKPRHENDYATPRILLALLKQGMSQNEVKEILGQPSSISTNDIGVYWNYGLFYSQFIEIQFNEDGVVEKVNSTLETQQNRPNQSLDLTVKTPVDPVSVLRTAGQA